jgi:peptidoglycan/xylan/chitin deacetylase (PgdA/CDA1 family)
MKWKWPEGRKAAISLSYDDGHPDNLDHAVPDLEECGLRGTFYLTTGRERVHKRADDWRSAFERGHEIGNHTVRHPARADDYRPNLPEWLPPEIWLENYTPADIMREVDEAAVWLNENVGIDPYRTFANPCCATAIGMVRDEASYYAAIEKHHFAARLGGNQTNDPRSTDILRIKSYGCTELSVDQLVEYCENAFDTCGWTVLMFHSIDGPSHNIRREVHRQLLGYLTDNSFWVAPVREVARFVRDERERPPR